MAGWLPLGTGPGSRGEAAPRVTIPLPVVNSSGDELTLTFTRPVTGFSGSSGFSVSGPGGDVVIAYVSGDSSVDIETGHSGPIVFSIEHSTGPTPIQAGEVLLLSYTPGVIVGSAGDAAPLKAFSNRAVTNNSAQGSTGSGFRSMLGFWLGGVRAPN